MQSSLPHSLYRVDDVIEGAHWCADQLGVRLYDLIEQAGSSAFAHIRHSWPAAKTLLILCGSGSKAGCGYVMARLAKQHGLQVKLWSFAEPFSLTGDANNAKQAWLAIGGKIATSLPVGLDGKLTDVDLIVDALVGVKHDDRLHVELAELIDFINQQPCPKFALDVPTGLSAHSGNVFDSAIIAEQTICFIALKLGLFIGQAPQYCGQILFADLGLSSLFTQRYRPCATLLQVSNMACLFRAHAACRARHKAKRVLCIGGLTGADGAIALCAQAALRTGARVVKVLTSKVNHSALLARQPELILASLGEKPENRSRNSIAQNKTSLQASQQLTFEMSEIIEHCAWADVLVLGAALGDVTLIKAMLETALAANVPIVLGADALILLAADPRHSDNWVLMPDILQASVLLNCTTDEIKRDLLAAANAIQHIYGGVVIIQAAGSIIYDGHDVQTIYTRSHSSTAAGMSYVLLGVIAASLALTPTLTQAAQFGTFLHNHVADMQQQTFGERGVVASDLLPLLGKNLPNS